MDTNLLARFDAGFTPGASSKTALERPVFNGYYTLTFPDGTHRTFRIHTKRKNAKFAAGQRILSVLVGSDNEEDKSYEGIAFLQYDGFHIWRRHRGTKFEWLSAILWEMLGGKVIAGHGLELSKRCLVCNHLLTDPESIKLGIGPSCRKREGWNR